MINTKTRSFFTLFFAAFFAISMMTNTVFANVAMENQMEFVGVPIEDKNPGADTAFLHQIIGSGTFDDALETTVFVFLNEQIANDVNSRGYLYSAITPQHFTKMNVDGKVINVVDDAMVNNILSYKPVIENGDRAICFHSYQNYDSPSYETLFTKNVNKNCRQKHEYQYQECSKCGAGRTTDKIVQEFPHEWVPYTGSGYSKKCTVCGMAKK